MAFPHAGYHTCHECAVAQPCCPTRKRSHQTAGSVCQHVTLHTTNSIGSFSSPRCRIPAPRYCLPRRAMPYVTYFWVSHSCSLPNRGLLLHLAPLSFPSNTTSHILRQLEVSAKRQNHHLSVSEQLFHTDWLNTDTRRKHFTDETGEGSHA